MGNEELGQPNSLALFCINVEDLEGKRAFSQLDMKSYIVRRTISLCNKEVLFSCWRKIGGTLKCYAVDG